VAYGAHRGAPEHRFPAAVQDVKRAIRWLKQESVPAGRVNGEQVVLFGASSGGQLAALVAATPGRFEPDGPDPDQVAFDSTVVALVSLAGPAPTSGRCFPTLIPGSPMPSSRGSVVPRVAMGS
jgi:acetyl esterase/lipase